MYFIIWSNYRNERYDTEDYEDAMEWYEDWLGYGSVELTAICLEETSEEVAH